MLHTSIEIHDLTVSYQNKPVLWGIDCHIPIQQLTALIGPMVRVNLLYLSL